jgi:hypothetical protein
LTVDAAIAQHANDAMLERQPIEVDGVSYAVKEIRARPDEGTAAFRLTPA